MKHPEVHFDDFAEDELDRARSILARETEELKRQVYPEGFSADDIQKAWSECHEEMIFLPSQKKFGRASAVDKNERLESVKAEFEATRANIQQEHAKAVKLEKKINLYTGGYQKRVDVLKAAIRDTVLELDQATIELESFRGLQTLEEKAIPKRVELLKTLVKQQEARESENQAKYYNLTMDKESFVSVKG